MLVAFQILLGDRFRLQVERQTRTLGIYVLTLGKGGINRLRSSGGCSSSEREGNNSEPPGLGRLPCGRVTMMFSPARSQLEGRNISSSDLVERLSNFVDRPIIDKTGYSGTLDVNLEFAPERAAFGLSGGAFVPGETPPAEPDARAWLSTAIRDQVGLRLESAKGPVSVIAIKHIDRPSTN
jgi:bla regulator protein blaR1